MKGIIRTIKDMIRLFISLLPVILMFVIPIIVALVIDWLIATSDLPDWFKYALLK